MTYSLFVHIYISMVSFLQLWWPFIEDSKQLTSILLTLIGNVGLCETQISSIAYGLQHVFYRTIQVLLRCLLFVMEQCQPLWAKGA